MVLVVGIAAALDIRGILHDVRAAERIVQHTHLAVLDEPGQLSSRAELIAARLASAADRADSSWSLDLVGGLPLVGTEVRSLRELTAESARLGRLASGTAAALEHRLEEHESPISPEERVDLLRAMAVELSTFRDELEGLSAPARARFPTLRSAADDLDLRVTRAKAAAEDAALGLRALADLVEGPADILVLGANNAEMRAGAGMVLTVGGVRMTAGSIEVARFRPTQRLTLDRSVTVPPDIRAVYGWLEPGREWRNTGVSPHFPATAPIYAAMAERAGLGTPDAVVQVDIVALRHLLEVLGPVTLRGREVSADEVEHVVLRDLYLELPASRERRRDGLAELADATFRALDARSWSPHGLVAALARAAEGRHLMAWSPDEGTQALFRRAGVAGALPPPGLLVSVQNHGANKLDWYVRPEVEVDVTRVAQRRRVDVTVAIPNDSPRGLPRYVAGGSQPGLEPGDYRALVTLHVPLQASDLTINPWITPRVVGRDGPSKVVGFRVDVPRGTTWRATVRFHLPPGAPLVVVPDGRLDR